MSEHHQQLLLLLRSRIAGLREARRVRAINAARIRLMPGKDRTLLSTEAIDALCAEFLALVDPKLLELLEQLQREADERRDKF